MRGDLEKIIVSTVKTLLIVISVIMFCLIYNVLSPLAGDNPQVQAVLENSQQTTTNLFNGWLVIDTIGGIVLFGGIIFGAVKLIMKIAENSFGFGPRGAFY